MGIREAQGTDAGWPGREGGLLSPGSGAGGWAHLLQVPQQLRGLTHMAGLWFPQAVQDGVDSFLVEQGPLRHSRVTSGTPVHPPQGLSPTSQPPLAPTPHAQSRDKVPTHAGEAGREGGALPSALARRQRAVPEDAGLPGTSLSLHPPTLCFLPPQGRGGGMEAQSGEQGEKTRCLGGLDGPLTAGTVPHRAGPGPGRCGPSLQPPSATHLFPQQASWGPGPRATFLVPRPPMAEVHWCSAAPAA